jgi:hypothetical protein
MTSRRTTLAVVLIALGLLTTACGSGQAAVRHFRVGIVADTQGWGSQMGQRQSLAASTGARWLREEIVWYEIEPRRGVFDDSRYDQLFAGAARRRLRILPLLMDTPDWAAASPLTLPSSPGDYAAYVAHVVARYGPGGSFWRAHPELPYRPATHFELWNEPFYGRFSLGGVSPARYAALVVSAVTAGRRANPRAKFLLAGVDQYDSPLACCSSWIDALFHARPDIGRFFDGVTVHPYLDGDPTAGDGFDRTLDEIRGRLAAHGADRPFWITEDGWTTCSCHDRSVTEARQAAYVSKLLALAAARHDVQALFLYQLQDDGRASSRDREDHFGLLRYDGSRKPAFAAFRRQALRYGRPGDRG